MSPGQRGSNPSYLTPKFDRYLELLIKWNRTYNLTAIEEPKGIRIKHFEDSLAPLPFLSAGCRLLDIGTGAGFPGIPLKIAKPDLEVVLIDSVRKKTAFCETVIRELKLKKIQVVQGRIENPSVIERLGLFDVVISRALFSLNDFLSMAKPYLKKNGVAIAMKGKDWRGEYKDLPEWKLLKYFDYELSCNLGNRSLVLFTAC